MLASYAKNLADAVKAEGVDTGKEKLNALLGRISKFSPKMRNNAGGHYNHEFFWKSMRASAEGNAPAGELQKSIVKDFGSVDAFKTQFSDAGKNRFGSGWAWLVMTNDKKLVVNSTPNQDNPLMDIAEVKEHHCSVSTYGNTRITLSTRTEDLIISRPGGMWWIGMWLVKGSRDKRIICNFRYAALKLFLKRTGL